MENLKARDFMNRQPAKVTGNTSIISALRIILEKKQSAAAVVDDKGHLIGILSEVDCIHGAMASGFYEQDATSVSQKMTTNVQTVTTETSLLAAIDIFTSHNRRILPVVENDKFVGMLSREHILQALLHAIDNPTQHTHSA